jgi:hypothetical protein
MFRDKLEECLKGIFELDRVIYGSIAEGAEQNAIYVNIHKVKTSPKDGECYFRVNGTLGINAEAVNYKYGYLKERCRLAPKKYTKYFGFASNDNNVNFSVYDDYFVKPSLDFTFRVSIPWNPAVGKIAYKKINWVLKVIDLIKGK